jgi:hypothetical protein
MFEAAVLTLVFVDRFMWLLDTTTLELHNFLTDIPDYVILSHTWGPEEVSFDDIRKPEVRRKLQGFDKVVRCCQQALDDRFEWAWIDSCCINSFDPAPYTQQKGGLLPPEMAVVQVAIQRKIL